LPVNQAAVGEFGVTPEVSLRLMAAGSIRFLVTPFVISRAGIPSASGKAALRPVFFTGRCFRAFGAGLLGGLA